MSYSQVATGRGDAGGLSEKSPPYMKREVYECHSEPRATAGGPDGCGNPVREGEAICQDFVRSRVKKSLSKEVSVRHPNSILRTYSMYFQFVHSV